MAFSINFLNRKNNYVVIEYFQFIKISFNILSCLDIAEIRIDKTSVILILFQNYHFMTYKVMHSHRLIFDIEVVSY